MNKSNETKKKSHKVVIKKKVFKGLKKNARNVTDKSKRGVIFVKHIPHGFFEPQMKRYFEQFGHVTRIKLSRSKKTGRSKGYAFVEFADGNVAKITADAMKDYLMFRHRMICQFIPRNEVHRDTFKRWNIPFKKPRAHIFALKRHNKISDDSKKEARRTYKLKKRNEKSLQKIRQLGIEYDLGT